MSRKPLFRERGELRLYFEAVKFNINKELESFGKKLLNIEDEALIVSLIEKYSQHAPVIHDEDKYILEQKEIDVLMINKDWFDPPSVKGTLLTIAVPFEGDANLFYYSPSSITSYPYGDIKGQEVHLEYKITKHDQEGLKKDIEREISKIKQFLEWVNRDVEKFNNSIEPFVREALRLRKAKLQKDADLVSSLDIPMKKRDDIPKTYTIPKIRKKPKIERPKDIKEPLKPEPVLDTKDYEDIIGTINSMALTIERNPKAFTDMEEEDLRWVFLIPLNALYEGQATGETFNYEGKTDILIRVENKNVFIAECKIWRGKEALIDAIDQLLGYTSWRDTKTAILLFFKGKNFSAILEKIPEAVKSHSCYVKELGKQDETIFKYNFHQRDDVNRELILSVMVFNIPSLEAT